MGMEGGQEAPLAVLSGGEGDAPTFLPGRPPAPLKQSSAGHAGNTAGQVCRCEFVPHIRSPCPPRLKQAALSAGRVPGRGRSDCFLEEPELIKKMLRLSLRGGERGRGSSRGLASHCLAVPQGEFAHSSNPSIPPSDY